MTSKLFTKNYKKNIPNWLYDSFFINVREQLIIEFHRLQRRHSLDCSSSVLRLQFENNLLTKATLPGLFLLFYGLQFGKTNHIQRRYYLGSSSSSSMGSNLEKQIIYCTRRLYLGSSSPSVSSNLEKQILYKDDIISPW